MPNKIDWRGVLLLNTHLKERKERNQKDVNPLEISLCMLNIDNEDYIFQCQVVSDSMMQHKYLNGSGY